MKQHLKTLRYLFGQVNYAGKIQRIDDQRILDAMIDDLFSEEVVFNQEKDSKLPPKHADSHHGFPEYHPTFSINDGWLPKFPEYDPITLYGFNYNIQRAHYISRANTLIDKLVYYES